MRLSTNRAESQFISDIQKRESEKLRAEKEKEGVDENYRRLFFSTEFALGAKIFFT